MVEACQLVLSTCTCTDSRVPRNGLNTGRQSSCACWRQQTEGAGLHLDQWDVGLLNAGLGQLSAHQGQALDGLLPDNRLLRAAQRLERHQQRVRMRWPTHVWHEPAQLIRHRQQDLQ